MTLGDIYTYLHVSALQLMSQPRVCRSLSSSLMIKSSFPSMRINTLCRLRNVGIQISLETINEASFPGLLGSWFPIPFCAVALPDLSLAIVT